MPKYLSRRDVLLASASLVALGLANTEAEAWIRGSAGVIPSQRSVLNLNNNSFEINEYQFIDNVKGAFVGLNPRSNSFASTAKTWPQVLDANGWPNDIAASGNETELAFQLPDPANFAGPYIIDGFGNGRLIVTTFGTSGLSLSVNSSSNVTVNATGDYTATGGASQFTINVTWTGTVSPSGPFPVTLRFETTGASGFFLNNVRFYRQSDSTDLGNGLIFRRGWKQPIVNLCPSAIRFMNILGGNADLNCRFENRGLPNNVTYCAGQGSQPGMNWTTSPVYPSATGTNQYTVGTATPTSANPKTTPASMQHGELATIRFTNGIARAVNSQLTVSAITNASPAQVQTSAAHGYNTGDIIVHYINLNTQTGNMNGTTTISSVNDTTNIKIGNLVFGPGIQAGTTVSNVVGSTVTLSLATTISGNGIATSYQTMGKLHNFPCKITVVDTTHYTIQTVGGVNIDTTTYGTFTASPITVSSQYISLQVGSGNDRTAYPVIGNDGGTPIAFFGGGVIVNGQYQTVYFDKQVSGSSDGAGNPIYGAWMTKVFGSSQDMGHSGDCPIEIAVALVNELNAMSPAHTIGLWMNLPLWGLCSIDPDYSTASNWAINALDVVLNPSSSNRAGGFSALGYSGLTQLNKPIVIIEHSNEIWNDNDAKGWLPARSQQRWGSAILGQSNFKDMHALRTTCMVRDIKGSGVPGLSNVKFIIGCWGSTGLSPGDFGGNHATVFGGSVTATPVNIGDWYTNDTTVVSGGWGKPIDNHDGICIAPYIDPPDAYYRTTTGTGTFTDDSAMYNGLNNSGNGGGNYTGAANQSQAITNFVNKTITDANDGLTLQINTWLTLITNNYSVNLPTGKVILNYEGAHDWQTFAGTSQSGHTLTSGDSTFSIAAINSSQWATAQTNFFNSYSAIAKCYMPSSYIFIGAVGTQKWAYCNPDSYATIASTPTEGAALTVNSPVWIAMGNRNQVLA